MTAPIRALIVDDEELSRRGLSIRLSREADFEVVGSCANAREAIAAIVGQRPDVVFLDIQMPQMSGFEMLTRLPTESTPLIVFVTAFDRHALEAFEARALDYLLKPVDEARFAQALARIRKTMEGRNAEGQRDRLLSLLAEVSGTCELSLDEVMRHGREALTPRYPEVLSIRQGRDVSRVRVASIEWIDAAGDYMCIHADGKVYILRGTMKELEELLDARMFQRVHRSTIVNLNRVQTLRAHMNGEYFLTLEGGHELKMSRSYRDKVEVFLQGK